VDIVPLDCLRVGETGRISDIDGCADIVTRLAEIGLRNGATIRMVQPGRPCILALDDQRLSFRPEECTHVYVEILPK
jgi:Fe2+ transport system protein FeoA